ncbi:MAG TPA: tetratricopeptide repeat protein [Tepidisphaeraceae bacterium]|nr:tetratricopeptide repeat protein [Tepidisphaeraceae bacterium]
MKTTTPTPTRSPPRRAGRLPLLLVLVVPLLALWPVITAEFISLDDPANVSRNEKLNPPTLRGVAWYWANPYLNMYAPLTYTAWAGVARLAWMDAVDEEGLQLNPYIFHAANLLVYLINAVLVFALLRKLLASDTRGDDRTDQLVAPPARTAWAACAGALLFALHPMQVEPVAWVTGFRDVLAAMFSLASLLAYLNHAMGAGRTRARSYLLACVFLVAALLCKPTTVTVPLVVAALDWGVLRRPLRDVAKPVAGLLLLVIPFVILTKRFQSAELTFTPPLWSRPIIAADALSFYALKLGAPVRLGMDYGRSPQWLLDQPGMGWLWLGIIPLGVGLWLLRRRLWATAGVAVFVLGVLPVLGLTKFDFQLHSTVADRYVYLAMLGPALLLAFLVRRGGRNTAIACSVALALLAVRSHVQTTAWHTSGSIYRTTLDTNRDSLIAHRGLGQIAMSSGRFADAEQHFTSALRVRPDDTVANFHLGNLYLATNRPTQAVPHLQIAAAAHDEPWVVTNYANALARSGNLAGARTALESALSKSPDSAELHASLAAVLFRQGDRAGAANHYRNALRINPSFTLAAQELAALETPSRTTSPSSQPPD